MAGKPYRVQFQEEEHWCAVVCVRVCAQADLVKKVKKNPNVDTSFLPDRDRAEAERAVGHPVAVVDSAQATAHELRLLLEARGLARGREQGGDLRLLVTDLPGRFAEMASRFVGIDVESLPVEAIDL